VEGTELPQAAAAAVGVMAAEGTAVVGMVLRQVGRRRLHSTPTSSNREGTALVGTEHLRARARVRVREGMELVPLLPLSSKEEVGMELVGTELEDMELELLDVDHLVEAMASHSVLRLSTTLRDLPLEPISSCGSGLLQWTAIALVVLVLWNCSLPWSMLTILPSIW
jgi:hypothetical protein